MLLLRRGAYPPVHFTLSGWRAINFPGKNRDASKVYSKFETLGAIRVQLKTDSRNLRSQKTIERIGGVKEGVLRNHMILPDGTIRHSVFYSILDSEGEGVRGRLEEYLAK